MRKQIPFAWRAAVLLIAIAGCGAVVWAQAPTLPTSAALVASPTDADPGAVRLLVGRSTVLDVGTPITRVSLTSPDIADALVTTPSQLLINGKLPGTISMFVWDRGGSLRRYEIIVQRDLARLAEQMKTLFPGEQIDVTSNGKNVVLSGIVTNKDIIEKAVNVAAGYVDKKDEVVPLLSLQVGAPSNQVLLHVRFAEVSRNTLTQLGANFFTGPGGYKNQGNLGRTTTGQFAAPNLDAFGDKNTLTFSDFLNLFFFSNKYNVGTVIQAMQQKGLFQSLAEPNLVAESGKEASFLAGGEFPVPIAQGIGSSLAVTVQYKEFGIRLSFTPTVVGERIQLKVRPEVSTLDFANAVTLNGFRIPALSTRRTETELELDNHQTFVIAGLLNNSVTSTLQKIPGIGDIPVLGLLFKSKEAQKNQTELVVMITPEILANNAPGAAPALPRSPEPYMPELPEKGSFPAPPPPFQPGRAANSPASGAATMTAMAPGAAPAVSAAPTPAPAQLATMPGSNAPTQAATHPMTEREKKALAQSQKQQAQKAAELAKAQAKADAAQAKADAKARDAAAKQAAEAKKKQSKQAKAEANKQPNPQPVTQQQQQ